MHTSTVLRASDFAYGRLRAGQRVETDFAAVFPDYHELDRVGVVSPGMEDGIRHTGLGLLALTTAFYDVQRARGGDFFTYPQHFALIGGDAETVQTYSGCQPKTQRLLGYTWGNLDVWPETNWFFAEPTALGMLGQVYALQINRLFWPEGLRPEPKEGSPLEIRLPDSARRLLRARLKAVYLYAAAEPNLEVRASERATRIIARSIWHLPTAEWEESRANSLEDVGPQVERYRQVPVSDFLAAMEGCFMPAAR